MDHINSICKKEEYPIIVEYSSSLGNHAKASRDIPRGEGLLRAIPYAAEVFDNYKKRMCHICLLYHNRGSFTQRCQDCDQVYYCSTACKAIAMDPLQGGHSKICKALRKLATWNSDRHTKSIIKLLLQVLMNHWRERQGIPTLYQSHKLSLELQKSSETQEGIQESDLTKDLESRLSIQEDQESSSMLSSREKEKDALQAKDLQKTIESESSETKSDKDIENERENRIQEPVENDFYDFLRLQSHFEDWDEEDNKDWNKQSNTVLSLLEMAGLTEMATERNGPLKTITSTDVKKLISALESNAFGMFDRTKNKPVCFGRAIYPIASFFNHSCECNSTAVQADGSMQEVTKDDILGYLNAEEEANILEKNTESSKQSTSPSTSTVSSLSGQTEDTGDDSKALHVEPSVDDNPSDAESESVAAVVDPYDSRVGQFRMMTFYSIEDITNDQDITISYIDTEMPLHARRLALLSDYHFHCCCTRCLREEKTTSSSSKKDSKSTGNGKKGKSKVDKKSSKKSK